MTQMPKFPPNFKMASVALTFVVRFSSEVQITINQILSNYLIVSKKELRIRFYVLPFDRMLYLKLKICAMGRLITTRVHGK